MNWDRVEGNWKQFRGKVREKWGKLTDDELDEIAGRKDQLLGKIQERYGIAKEEAERQLADWERRPAIPGSRRSDAPRRLSPHKTPRGPSLDQLSSPKEST